MFKGIVRHLQDYFGISLKEARGALVLIIVCFLLLWTPFVFRRYILPLVPLPSEPPPKSMLDSLASLLEKENRQKNGRPKYSPKKYASKPARAVRLFHFDPNVVSVDQMEELGIPSFLARRIDKFRSKGGKFRKKADLLEIYDFPSDLYKRLEGYMVLAETPNPHIETKVNPDAKTYLPKVHDSKTSRPVAATFDINTADTTQLIKLRGIGSKLSVRILKFRDALGGFHSASQYSEIFGLDSIALSELNRYAKVNSAVKKININTASIEELTGHSYLRNKKIAAIIVNYRDQHGPFQHVEDLKKVKVVDENTIRKIEPYLAF